MTLSVLEGHSTIALLQAFPSAIFRICGASRGSSVSAELLVGHDFCDTSFTDRFPKKLSELLYDTGFHLAPTMLLHYLVKPEMRCLFHSVNNNISVSTSIGSFDQ